MVRKNDTRKWQLRQWHGRLRPREAKRSSGAGASSEELDAGRWPELPINVTVECCERCEIYILDVCEQVQLAECKDCRIIVAPVQGSVMLFDCERCVVSIASTWYAFAALHEDGSVSPWGASLSGGNAPATVSYTPLTLPPKA